MTKFLKSAFAGVLFWSAFYWNVVLSWVVPSWLNEAVLILLPVVVNLAMFFLLSGRRKLEVLKNLAISAASGIMTFLYYRQSGFLPHWFSVLNPESRMTGNEGLGISLMTIIYASFYMFALILAFAVSDLKATRNLCGTKNN